MYLNFSLKLSQKWKQNTLSYLKNTGCIIYNYQWYEVNILGQKYIYRPQNSLKMLNFNMFLEVLYNQVQVVYYYVFLLLVISIFQSQLD